MSNKMMSVGLAAFLGLFAAGARAAQTGAERAIAGWNDSNKHAAQVMIEKYGQPDAYSADWLQWSNRGSFKRIVVDGRPDAPGIVAHTVSYEVPSKAIGLLSLKDSYVVPNRDAGELTAFSAGEERNVLALNAADKVMRGRLDVDQAREFQERTSNLLSSGKSSPASEKLQFRPGVDPLFNYVYTTQD